MAGDDRDLYESFRALRREEEARVPPISMLSLAARRQSRRGLSGKLVAATLCLAAIIAAAVWLPAAWLLPRSRVPREGLGLEQEQATASITSWKPATDFLLDTPGRELLQSVPAIGEWHGVMTAPGTGERHRHFSIKPCHKE